jgi:hypothetical protein
MTKRVGVTSLGFSQEEGQQELLDNKLMFSSAVYGVHEEG